jgi:hypothetical protein
VSTQPHLGRFCEWCGEPAVTELVLEPGHSFAGKRGGAKVEMWRAPRVVDVCAAHVDVRDRQGGVPLPDLRRRKATNVVQLDIFGNEIVDGTAREPGNAIKGTQ